MEGWRRRERGPRARSAVFAVFFCTSSDLPARHNKRREQDKHVEKGKATTVGETDRHKRGQGMRGPLDLARIERHLQGAQDIRRREGGRGGPDSVAQGGNWLATGGTGHEGPAGAQAEFLESYYPHGARESSVVDPAKTQLGPGLLLSGSLLGRQVGSVSVPNCAQAAPPAPPYIPAQLPRRPLQRQSRMRPSPLPRPVFPGSLCNDSRRGGAGIAVGWGGPLLLLSWRCCCLFPTRSSGAAEESARRERQTCSERTARLAASPTQVSCSPSLVTGREETRARSTGLADAGGGS